MYKLQEFVLPDGRTFTAPSIHWAEDDVWQSDFCDPNEWNTEREMRLDMLIEYLTDGIDYNFFASWNCYDEDEFIEKYYQFID
jgi:hypothetical protein